MQGLGWRLVRTMATSGFTPSTALDAIRQQKKALRTIVRRQLRNLSPDVKHQEGKPPSLITLFSTASSCGELAIDNFQRWPSYWWISCILHRPTVRSCWFEIGLSKMWGKSADEEIQKHILAANWYQKSKRICAYVSCSSLREVDTSYIMYRLAKNFLHKVYEKIPL